MPHARSVCVLVATLAPFTFQGQAGSAQRSLPPPTDIDAQFTEQLRQAEQQFCKAILNKDARTLDSLVSPNFALRVADVPEGLPAAYRLDGQHSAPDHGRTLRATSRRRAQTRRRSRGCQLGLESERDVRWTRLQRRLLFGRFLAEEQRELADYRPGTPLRSASFPSGRHANCRPLAT